MNALWRKIRIVYGVLRLERAFARIHHNNATGVVKVPFLIYDLNLVHALAAENGYAVAWATAYEHNGPCHAFLVPRVQMATTKPTHNNPE